jgi:hypothetical protein
MKIDRFVKVMLVLIAMLLALNCAKDLNQPSNTRVSSDNVPPTSANGNSIASSKTSGGNSSPLIFESPVEAATPPTFLQVGKTYNCIPTTGGGGFRAFEVLEIQNTGWVKVPNGWVNPNTCVFITPAE